ncbi:MAG: MFS transporter, partial [Actinomycetota bacterium]|nr:MFS transporter [Actinomycetota bacterium]
FLLFSGVLSDRVQRRRLLIIADIVRMVAIGAMGAITLAGSPRLWEFVVLAAIYGVGEALFGPSFHAMVPDLVSSELLIEANSLGQLVRPMGQILIGPAIGGFLVSGIGPGGAFVIDAVTFAFSALMILSMQARPPVARSEETSVMHDLKEGLGYVRSRTWLWASMAAATLSLLCFIGPFDVLVPYVVKNLFGGSAKQLGLVFAAGGLGSVIVAGVMGQRRQPKRPLTTMYLSWALGTALLAGFGLAGSVGPMYVVSFVCNAAFTVVMVLWFTVVARLVPAEFLGRVSSIDWMISTGGFPLSYALTGPIAAAIGVRATLIGAGVLGATTILLTVWLVPGTIAPDHDGSLDQRVASDPPA